MDASREVGLKVRLALLPRLTVREPEEKLGAGGWKLWLAYFPGGKG